MVYIYAMKFYLYIHRKKDNNEIFYVGISRCRKSTKGINYIRAASLYKRNSIWKRIVAKHGFYFEIVEFADTQYEIKQKEIEYIKKYGRLDNNTGILSNMTDGGDGRLNGTPESYEINKQNLAKYRELKKKKCYQYDLQGNFIREFNSITEASIEIGDTTTSGIISCCKEKINHYYGYVWRYDFSKKLEISIKSRKYSKVFEYSKKGIFIKEWNNSKEAGDFYNISYENIDRSCKNKIYPICNNSQWSYIKKEKLNSIVSKTVSKKIVKIDIASNEIIQEYDSLIEASENNNLSFKAISSCALGKSKTSGGFKWKYL